MNEVASRKVISRFYFWTKALLFRMYLAFLQRSVREKPDGWTDELVVQCRAARSVKVYIPSCPPIVYVGLFDDIYKNGNEVFLILQMSHACSQFSKDEIYIARSITDLFKAKFEFRLDECCKPVFIKDDTCDCVWFGFSNGHVVIHFEKPGF